MTPEKFAEMMCEDLELSTPRFVKPIADSIRTQVLDFESINDVQLPDPYLRVTIDVSLYRYSIIIIHSPCILYIA